MTDQNDDGSEDDKAGLRADRLSRALAQAREARGQKGNQTSSPARKRKLPPPPPAPELYRPKRTEPEAPKDQASPEDAPPKPAAPPRQASSPIRSLRSKDGRLPPPPPLDPEDYKALGIPMPPEIRAALKRTAETATPPNPQQDRLILEESSDVEAESQTEAKTDSPYQEIRPEPETILLEDAIPSPGLFAAAAQNSAASQTHHDAPPALTVSSLCTDIGQYEILRGVDFSVPKGNVTMLLGRNGAGKTTTLRSIMGLWRPKYGEIQMGGRDLTRMSPTAIARAGVGYVPEDMGIFSDLTVEENMRLAARRRLNRARVDWLLQGFPALRTFWRSPAGTLSGGQKQMLSLARALVEPRELYLIDEPTKGLAPAIVANLVDVLRELKHEGASILMVEQNFAVARALGDTCAVMDDGRVIWRGDMGELASDRDLQDRLLGLSMETSP